MKQIVLTSIVLFSFSLVFSQPNAEQVSLVWGPRSKCKKSIPIDIIGNIQGKTYTIRYNESQLINVKQYLIREFNESFENTREERLVLKYQGNNVEYIDDIQIGNKIFFITALEEKIGSAESLYLQELDTEELAPSNEGRLIAKFDNPGDRGNYKLEYSKDSSRLILYSITNYFPVRSKIEVAFSVFDSSMNEIWHRKVPFPMSHKEGRIYDVSVSNSGNVYVAARKQVSNSALNASAGDYDYLIYGFTKDQMEFFTTSLELMDTHPIQIELMVNDNEEVYCSGFTNKDGVKNYDEPRMLYTTGFIMSIVDGNNGDLLVNASETFPNEIYMATLSDKGKAKFKEYIAKGKQVPLPEYRVKYSLISKDKTITIIGENVRDALVMLNNKIYISGSEIIVIKLDKNGKIVFLSQIPRHENMSEYPYDDSFGLIKREQKLHLLYTGRADKPFNGKNGTTVYPYYDCNLMMATVMSDGTFSIASLAEVGKKSSGVLPLVYDIFQLSQDAYIMYADWQNHADKMVKLTFE